MKQNIKISLIMLLLFIISVSTLLFFRDSELAEVEKEEINVLIEKDIAKKDDIEIIQRIEDELGLDFINKGHSVFIWNIRNGGKFVSTDIEGRRLELVNLEEQKRNQLLSFLSNNTVESFDNAADGPGSSTMGYLYGNVACSVSWKWSDNRAVFDCGVLNETGSDVTVDEVKLNSFCKTKNNNNRTHFVNSIRASANRDGDFFIACIDDIDQLFLYIVNFKDDGYNVIWEERTMSDGFNLRSVTDLKIIDIDGDGIDEIFLSGSNHGGTCTGSYKLFHIYSPKYEDIFSLYTGESFDDNCEFMISMEPRFSDNLSTSGKLAFKNYLKEFIEN